MVQVLKRKVDLIENAEGRPAAWMKRKDLHKEH